MVLPIGHFAVGVVGAFLILLYKPELIPNFIKNDTFFIMLSGLWAMVPDIGYALAWKGYANEVWMNIFWFHEWLDRMYVTKHEEIKAAMIAIAVALVLGYLYFKKVNP